MDGVDGMGMDIIPCQLSHAQTFDLLSSQVVITVVWMVWMI